MWSNEKFWKGPGVFGILEFCTFELFNSLLSYLCFNINHWKKVLAVIILSLEGQQPPRWQITSKTLNANHVLFSKMPIMPFLAKCQLCPFSQNANHVFFIKVPIMYFLAKCQSCPFSQNANYVFLAKCHSCPHLLISLKFVKGQNHPPLHTMNIKKEKLLTKSKKQQRGG